MIVKAFLACVMIYSIVYMSLSMTDMIFRTPGLLANGARLVKKVNDVGYDWVFRFTIICVSGIMGALVAIFVISQLVTLLLVLSIASISSMVGNLYSFFNIRVQPLFEVI